MRPCLILLTGSFEAKVLLPLLQHNHVSTLHIQSLEEWPRDLDTRPIRLLAFCTAVIVPGRVLAALPGPSYNIHPGPPCYPGRHPESWAAYDGAARFGATLHEMAPRVDEGAIVDVQWVDVPRGGGQLDYGMLSFRASIDLLLRWRHLLLHIGAPLPLRRDLNWSGPKRTHAQLDAMCHVEPGIDADELARRQRAFAQVPGSRLTLGLHGRTFVHTVPEPPNADTDIRRD